MTDPTSPPPENSSAWSEYMRTHDPRGVPNARKDLPGWHMGQLLRDIVVAQECPGCGTAEAWKVAQTLGEIHGLPGVPAAGGGVQMRCGKCGTEAIYRERDLTDKEVGQRNALLLRGGRRP